MQEPAHEANRLIALQRYRIADTPREPAFDDLALLAATVCDAPIALIGCIERDRIWLKARHGTAITELPAAALPEFDASAAGSVLDLAVDAREIVSGSGVGEPPWRYAAGAHILSDDGYPIGLLAIADTRRRRISDSQRSTLEILARQAASLFELHRLRIQTGGAQASIGPSSIHRRVLVVDDVEAAATTLARVLDAMGHDTRVAHDGPRALAIAKDYRPDVILLDLGMPGMSGFVVARLIRAQSGLEGTTLIAVTGHGRDEDRRQALDAGFDHHLLKPLDLEQMRALLDELPRANRVDIGIERE
ncbi:MAG: response regulator [Casimicrobiaceae bacterium]